MLQNIYIFNVCTKQLSQIFDGNFYELHFI